MVPMCVTAGQIGSSLSHYGQGTIPSACRSLSFYCICIRWQGATGLTCACINEHRGEAWSILLKKCDYSRRSYLPHLMNIALVCPPLYNSLFCSTEAVLTGIQSWIAFHNVKKCLKNIEHAIDFNLHTIGYSKNFSIMELTIANILV